MHEKLIACDVMRKEIEAVCAERGVSPERYDADFLEMGLHDQPEKLRAELCVRVEALRDASYDAILLGFGLCSNSVVGLAAPGIPLVVPRMHDCIALFMGSRAHFQAEHDREPGTYWFARGFLHRQSSRDYYGIGEAAVEADARGIPDPDGLGSGSPVELEGMGGMAGGNEQDGGGGMYSASRRKALYEKWVEEYGEENAQYLMEEWLDAWKKNYKRAAFLSWANDPDVAADRERVRCYAEENRWSFAEFAVDLGLLRGLLNGDWKKRPDDYLIVPPGHAIQAAHGSDVIRSVPV